MAITAEQALILSKGYTEQSLVGLGALKGKNCQIKKVEKTDEGSVITFLWVDDNNISHETQLTVKDGKDCKQEFQKITYADYQVLVQNKTYDKEVIYVIIDL